MSADKVEIKWPRYGVGQIVDVVLSGNRHFESERIVEIEYSEFTGNFRYRVSTSAIWFSEGLIRAREQKAS